MGEPLSVARIEPRAAILDLDDVIEDQPFAGFGAGFRLPIVLVLHPGEPQRDPLGRLVEGIGELRHGSQSLDLVTLNHKVRQTIADLRRSRR